MPVENPFAFDVSVGRGKGEWREGAKGRERNTGLLRVFARDLDSDLRDLVAQGLAHYDVQEGRFDLHLIVRRSAYDRLAAPGRAAARTRLCDHFAFSTLARFALRWLMVMAVSSYFVARMSHLAIFPAVETICGGSF